VDHFITIMTFTHPSELLILRGKLESEGIECQALDEFTTQVNPLYSNAIGGVKLQVKESDLPRTIEILKEGGYIKEEDLHPPSTSTGGSKHVLNFPLIKNWRAKLRLAIIITVSCMLLIFIIRMVTSPPIYEQLTKQNWCVDQVYYDGKSYTTNTVERLQVTGYLFCRENMELRTNGTVILPGFHSRAAWGKWTFENDVVQITKTDTFAFVYNGVYEINLSGSDLILESAHTTLYCHPQKFDISQQF
jgi:hypothetical protein